jgi:hypothetical protein
LLPLPPHLIQAVGTQLELLADSAKDGSFFLIRRLLELAGDPIRPLALGTVIHEGILRSEMPPRMVEKFGKDAGPEEGEIADVPVNLTCGASLGGELLGFEQHIDKLMKRPTC